MSSTKTTLYELSRDCKPEPLEEDTVTYVIFYQEEEAPGLFTIEEQRKGLVLNRTAYSDREIDKRLAEWEAKGFTQI